MKGSVKMAGSVMGEIFKISTWGESHGHGIGVVVDGCPAVGGRYSAVFGSQEPGADALFHAQEGIGRGEASFGDI